MKTITKTLILVTGLGISAVGASVLFAHGGFGNGYGMMNGGGYPGMMHQWQGNRGPMMGNQQGMQPGYGGYGNTMGPGMGRGMMGNQHMMQPGYGNYGPNMMPGMMNGGHMGPGMMGFQGADPSQTLANTKSELGITADQETAWNTYSNALQAHYFLARANHQAMHTQQKFDPTVHNGMHQSMVESRQKLADAYRQLSEVLTPEQLQKAQQTIANHCAT